MISRRTVQTLLGIIWLCDGLLQLKPKMFTAAFIHQVILPTAEGQPHWISSLIRWGAEIALPHLIIWNTLFSLIQILLGLAFVLNIMTKRTIIASIIWSGIVWVFGEGFGLLFTGQSLLLTGAPGAAFIYGLVALCIWPDHGDDPSAWSPTRLRLAQLSLAGLFMLGCVTASKSVSDDKWVVPSCRNPLACRRHWRQGGSYFHPPCND